MSGWPFVATVRREGKLGRPRTCAALACAGLAGAALVCGAPACADEQPGRGASGRSDPVTAPDDTLFESETGSSPWHIDPGPRSFALEEDVARRDGRSLRVDTLDGSARFSRRLSRRDLDGDRLRFGARVRADPKVVASLSIRVTGQSGLIYVDRVSAPRSPDGGWTEVSIEAPLSASAERVEIGGRVSGRGSAWFDGISVETLEAATLPAPVPAAVGYVEQALAIISRHSLKRGELDWPDLVARVQLQSRGARDVQDAYLAVRYALGELGDGHSYFMAPAQMSRLAETPVSNARTGRPPMPPQGRLLAPGVGYLHVPGFAGGEHRAQQAFASELQRIIAALGTDGACAFVVDLRDNSGGNLWPMIVGLGPLLGEGDVGAAVYPDSTRRTFWYRDGKAGLEDFVQLRVYAPHRLERPPAAVAVLTGRATASAAEVLAAAFRAAARTRSFGAPTRGAHTSTRVFPLADGAAIVLAVAATSNRLGETFVGPIEPDEPVASARRRSETALDEDPVVRAAVAWLARDGECAPTGPAQAAAR